VHEDTKDVFFTRYIFMTNQPIGTKRMLNYRPLVGYMILGSFHMDIKKYLGIKMGIKCHMLPRIDSSHLLDIWSMEKVSILTINNMAGIVINYIFLLM
jgi:hypothetical protein